ncbi:hypothetical protein BZG02_19835 [Labilibaculum filiforme]|uniref:Uncharacterized protein n=1 Tax=Labilibaculum filiforme TaxID=1940526 RepID=A0A2N3HQJ1_9BACT|nr:hypothetical protein [Labilibaculum filiforme]PKQ60307.1 hypothetical protein BZG02_19835 [Labilibaculum filiforme]
MKLRFLSLGLLALSFVACETYEESDSVEAMRVARTEYIKAETAYQNAQVAYKEAETAGKLVANAVAEAQGSTAIATAQLALDKAIAELASTKAILEANIASQKQNLLNLKDGMLTSAYGDYTTAYNDWNTTSDDLLTAQNDLVSANFTLASAGMASVNFKATETVAKNLVVTTQTAELAELNSQLAAYEALQASNDWTSVEGQVVAKELEKAELNAEIANLSASIARAVTKKDVAYAALEQWNTDYDLSAPIDADKGIIEMAAAFNAHRDVLVNDTIAPSSQLDAAKTILDASDATDGGYNVLKENYNNALANYNEAIAKLNAYNFTVANAQLSSLNAVYVSSVTSIKPLSDQQAVLGAKLGVLSADIIKLKALQFVIDTDVTEGTVDVSDKLADMITSTKEDIVDVEDAIAKAKDVLAKLEAGNYTQAESVRDAELAISILNTKIAKLTAELEVAKTKLDTAEAAYKALLN